MPQAILVMRQSTSCNLRAMIITKYMKQSKSKICGGGLNAGQSPPHPPSKKAAIPDHS